MLDVAVAFMIFNRPEETRRGFAPIRQAQPRKLFLVSDAARPDRPGESERVAAARAIAEDVDWECDVVRLYAESNLGCGRRISSGITQALRDVDRLIVLEDDCVADASFFPYCRELLARYADDERVMAISGNNFQQGRRRGDASYYFSKYPHCWGWATWRRAWQHFDLEMNRWPALRDSGWLASICTASDEHDFWRERFDRAHAGRTDTWDHPWVLACWAQGGLTALPSTNLVSNIGFGNAATHTSKTSPLANLPVEPLRDLIHCERIERDVTADEFTYRDVYAGRRKTAWPRIRQWMRHGWRQRAA